MPPKNTNPQFIKGLITQYERTHGSHVAFIEAARWGGLDEVMRLRRDGVDVNCTDGQDGVTALMLAASAGETDVVRYLLQQGADASVRANNGGTALLAAVGGMNSQRKVVQTIKMLLKAGADAAVADHEGRTPYQLAQGKYGDPVLKLLQIDGPVAPQEPSPSAGSRDAVTIPLIGIYWYMVDYDPNVAGALQALREREFRAGRYFPALRFPQYPVRPDSPAPGPQHASIEDAREDVAEVGTYSILDLDHVSATPETCALTALKDDQLLELYGTTRPTREVVDFENGWAEFVDRAQGIYVAVYEDEKPRWLFIGGRAYD